MFVEDCLSSYTNQNVSLKRKHRCEQQEITSIRTSDESHVYWKKQFLMNPLSFRIYADFEADNEMDISSGCKRTTSIFEENPVCFGYYILSELKDVLKGGSYESPLGYNTVDWFVN